MEKQVILVGGMSCNHCKNAVEGAVKALPGVQSAQVNLADKTLTVEFDAGQTTLEQMKAAIAEEGYTVE